MTAAPVLPVDGLLGVPGVDRERLRRAKRGATGLLLATAAVFLVTLALPDSTLVGFVRAAAEAGMIGGLADWFAVTALFRHPLGLPVPHTALIPRQKDELATKLGEFVHGNFLTPDGVAEQVGDARLVGRLAGVLAEPVAAQRVSREVAALLAAGLDAVDEVQLTDLAVELVRRDLARRSYTPVLGQLLARAVEGRVQRPLVDVLVARAHDYLREHREVVHPYVRGVMEGMGFLAFLAATDARVAKLVDGVVDLLGAVREDPDHELRRWLDGLLERLVDDLRYDARTARSLDAQLAALVEDVHVQRLVHALLSDLTASARFSLRESDGALADRLTGLVQEAAAHVRADPALERRLEERLLTAVRYAVEHFGEGAVELIRRTVAGWDARDASDRIELAVGRDLQFIRINGTVVGALAGVVIHAVAVGVG